MAGRVLRPDARTWWALVSRPDRAVLSAAAGLVATAAGGLSGQRGLLVLGLVVTGSVAVGLGWAALLLRGQRVVLEEGSVTYRRWGRSSSVRTDGAVGLLARYSQPMLARDLELLVLCGPDGTRIRLNGGFWSPAALAEIAAHSGVPSEPVPLTAAGFEERAPGAVPWRDRHPWLAGTLVALVLTAVAAVVVFAVS